jgi:hypothetical protein
MIRLHYMVLPACMYSSKRVAWFYLTVGIRYMKTGYVRFYVICPIHRARRSFNSVSQSISRGMNGHTYMHACTVFGLSVHSTQLNFRLIDRYNMRILCNNLCRHCASAPDYPFEFWHASDDACKWRAYMHVHMSIERAHPRTFKWFQCHGLSHY